MAFPVVGRQRSKKSDVPKAESLLGAGAEEVFQVLTGVNVSAGTLTKSPDQLNFVSGTLLTLTAARSGSSGLSGDYACVYLVNSQNERVENSSLGYSGFNAGLTYSYHVDADTVWTAQFEQYLTLVGKTTDVTPAGGLILDYQCPFSELTGGVKAYMNIFPGHNLGFAESLPEPRRRGYYFRGWFSSASSNATRVGNSTDIPYNVLQGNAYELYAQWTPAEEKYRVSGFVDNNVTGVATVNTPERGYFLAGETCRIDLNRYDTWAARLRAYTKTEAKVGGVFQEINKDGVPFDFIVGEHPAWEYQDPSQPSNEKRIDIRLCYVDGGIYVSTTQEPLTGYGTVDQAVFAEDGDSHNSYFLPGDTIEVTAHPNTDRDAKIVRWEQKVGTGDWRVEWGSGDETTRQFYVQEGGSNTIRVVYGQDGVLTYDVMGGSPSIPSQAYLTRERITLSDSVPVIAGSVFIGWSEAPYGTPLYAVAQEGVSFTETSKTLYARYYASPQSIQKIRHWDVASNSEYEGEKATVTAQVSEIGVTSRMGRLQGTLSWTITMPPSGTSDAKFSKMSVGIGGGDYDSILESTETSNSGGVQVTFSYTVDIEEEWVLTVYYNTGDKHFVYYLPNAEGVENMPPSHAFDEAQSFYLSAIIPIYSGHAFMGWLSDDDHPKIYQPNALYEGLSVQTGFATLDDISFAAQWAEGVRIPVVHHNLTLGENSAHPISNATARAVRGADTLGVHNYTIYWSISDVKQGYLLSPSPSIVITTEPTAQILSSNAASGSREIQLYSDIPPDEWTATVYYYQNAYSLVYDTRGGTPSIQPQIIAVAPGATATISYLRPKRWGYEFLGWTENANSAMAQFQPGDEIAMSRDVLLYAVYEETSDSDSDSDVPPEPPYDPTTMFTAYGQPDNTSHGAVSPSEQTFQEGETVSFTVNSFFGYRFLYWIEAGAGGSPLSTDTTYSFVGSSAENGKTYVAVFEAQDVRISSGLIYYEPTGKLMSYDTAGKTTLIWNDMTGGSGN